MAISLVTSISATPAGSSATTGSADTSGATLLVAVVVRESSSGAVTVSDSKGNSWTALTEPSGGASGVRCRIYYCASPTVGSGHTFTAAASGLLGTILVLAFSGTSGTPFDQENGANSSGNTATFQAGTITPSEDNGVVVAGVAVNNGITTDTIDESYTIQEKQAFNPGVAYGGAAAYKIQTTATATNPTWTLSGNRNVSAVIASFKSASAPPAAVKLLTLLGVG